MATRCTLNLNFIIENNIDRVEHTKHGIPNIWDVSPNSDKTARGSSQNFFEALLDGKFSNIGLNLIVSED